MLWAWLEKKVPKLLPPKKPRWPGGGAHEVKELLVRAWGLVSVLAFVGGDHQARILAGALHALSNWTIGSGASVVVPACMEDTIIITSI